ncbi:MAG: restriction endonuclease subunit S [Chloroflexota bacterium]|nr:restriction endonuclease subunit S [Chloroflexota bacterium]
MTTLHQDSDVQLIELGDIVTSAQSGFASGERDANGVVQLRMNNVTTEGALDWSNVLRVPGTKKQVKKYQLLPGDILFNATNSPNLVGKTAVFKGYQEPIVFSNHFVRLRADSTNVDSNYLGLWFTRQWQLHIFEHLCTQWVNQATVRKEDLLLLKVPLPSLPEQRRIAALLDKADHLRRTRRYAAQLSDTFLQAVFVRMFGDPVRNPMGWEKATLEELGKVTTGSTPPTANQGMFGGSIPFITPSDLEVDTINTGRYVTEEGAVESRIVRAGSTMVCCIGATIGKMDKTRTRSTFNQQINAIEWGTKINDDYGLAMIRFYAGFIAARGKSTTLPILKKSEFEEIAVPIPPLALQEKFARVVQQFERLRAQQREAERQAEHLFQTLLHRAFSGEA